MPYLYYLANKYLHNKAELSFTIKNRTEKRLERHRTMSDREDLKQPLIEQLTLPDEYDKIKPTPDTPKMSHLMKNDVFQRSSSNLGDKGDDFLDKKGDENF